MLPELGLLKTGGLHFVPIGVLRVYAKGVLKNGLATTSVLLQCS